MSDMSASVILRLVDELTGPARKIQSTLKGIARDIERLNKLSGRSSGAGRQFDGLMRGARQATAAASKLRSEMARPIASGFARKAASEFTRIAAAANRATVSVNRLNAAMRRGNASGSRQAHVQSARMQGFAPALSHATSAAHHLASAAGHAASALRRVSAPAGRAGAGGGGGHSGGGGRSGGHASGRGWLGGGHGGGPHLPGSGIFHSFKHALAFQATEGVIEMVKSSVEGSLKQSFDLQHTKAMLRIQGEKSDTVDAVVNRAREMAKTIPSFTTAQHAAAIAELRPAMIGGIKEAMHLAPQFQQAVAVMEAVKSHAGAHSGLKGIDSHGEALDLARALELKGVMGDGDEAIKSYMNNMVKAIVAFNGQINAADFHAALKFGRGATRGWSEEFVSQYLPTIMNDIKPKGGSASGAGNALASFSRTVVDRVMKQTAMEEWDKLGLVDKKKVKYGKGHKIQSIDVGGMVGWEKAIENPYKYMQENLLPAINRKFKQQNGGKDATEKQIIGELGTLFGNRVAQMLAMIMTVQKKQIEKDAQNVREAMGIDGLAKLQKMDPTARTHVLSAAFKDLGGALGDIASPGILRGMLGLTKWAHSLRDSVISSPYMKALSGRFEALVAGIFGQHLGRKQFANGRNREYWAAGKYMGDGWSRASGSTGKFLKILEESGLFTEAVHQIGVELHTFSGYMDGINKLLNHDWGSSIKQAADLALKGAGDLLGGYTEKDLERDKERYARDEQKAAGRDFSKQFGPFLPPKPKFDPIRPDYPHIGGPTKLPPMVAAGSKLARSFTKPQLPTFAAGGAGLPSPSSIMQPIASAASSVTPMFAKGGSDAIQALANGLQSGAGAATGVMTSLMGSLAAIAAAGVTVPVKLDTAGAEAKLNSLMAKAGSIGSGGAAGRPQYSPALNDGH